MSSDVDPRGCVLFVSPGANIASPYSGQGARFHRLSRGLATNWRVLTLVPDEVGDEPIPWADAQYTYARSENPFHIDATPSYLTTLEAILERHDIDMIHLSRGVFGAAAVATRLASDASVVYAAQNVEAVHQHDFDDNTIPVESRSMGPQTVAAIERLAVICADRITTVSRADRRTFREHYDVAPSRIRAIPTGTTPVDLESLPSRDAVRSQLGLSADTVAVFHGWYGHRANQEAVAHLRETVAPALWDATVELEFLLVGKGMPDWDVPNVTSTGFVDDLWPVLNSADFAVVPTLHGGGTKTKVYDYLSVGLPIVTTRNGIAGTDLVPGKHCLASDGVDDTFVEHVRTLASSPERRNAMHTANRRFASEHTWQRSVDCLDAFYRELV